MEGLKRLGVERYYCAAYSQLGASCDALYIEYGTGKQHIFLAVNEGDAVGTILDTGKPVRVYMQSSGIGNAVYPIVSFLSDAVYAIPCRLVESAFALGRMDNNLVAADQETVIKY